MAPRAHPSCPIALRCAWLNELRPFAHTLPRTVASRLRLQSRTRFTPPLRLRITLAPPVTLSLHASVAVTHHACASVAVTHHALDATIHASTSHTPLRFHAFTVRFDSCTVHASTRLRFHAPGSTIRLTLQMPSWFRNDCRFYASRLPLLRLQLRGCSSTLQIRNGLYASDTASSPTLYASNMPRSLRFRYGFADAALRPTLQIRLACVSVRLPD